MKIVLKELTKRFPNRDHKKEEVTAVDHFSFEIPDGELVSLLGPSGCGKSTTLNMICGLEQPTEGHIFFGEEEVTNLPPELRGVGMVFQSYALYPHLSVRKNILFPLQNLTGASRLSKEEMNRSVVAFGFHSFLLVNLQKCFIAKFDFSAFNFAEMNKHAVV